MSPSAIIRTPVIASLVAMRLSTFVFQVCGLTPRIRHFLRGRGTTNGSPWRKCGRTFPMVGRSLRPAREFSSLNAAVTSRRFSVPVSRRAMAPGGWKTTIICLCRICLQAVSLFSAARGVPLPDHRLTARLFRNPRHLEQ